MKKIVLIASITLSFLILSCSANSGPAAGSGTDGNTQNGGSGGGTTAPLTDIEIFANEIKNKKVRLDGTDRCFFSADGKSVDLSGVVGPCLIYWAEPDIGFGIYKAIYVDSTGDYVGFEINRDGVNIAMTPSFSRNTNDLQWHSMPSGPWYY